MAAGQTEAVGAESLWSFELAQRAGCGQLCDSMLRLVIVAFGQEMEATCGVFLLPGGAELSSIRANNRKGAQFRKE